MEDFVLYDEALEMKDIGFDEPCFGYWFTNPQKKYIPEIWQGSWENMTSQENIRTLYYGISAPTYAQCFKWFRNIGYDIWLPKIDDKYQYVIKFDFGYTGGFDSRTNITSYEEAELLCLRNLIELYKQKINREKLGK